MIKNIIIIIILSTATLIISRCSEDIPSIIDLIQYSYNKNGNLTKTEYANNGNPIRLTEYDKNGAITSINTYEYYSNGELSSITSDEYDKNGKLINTTIVKYKDDSSYTVTKYEYDTNEKITSIINTEYDENGNIIDRTKTEFDDNSNYTITEHNEKGDPAKITKYDENRKIIKVTEYKYEYNANEDPTKITRTEYDENGNLTDTAEFSCTDNTYIPIITANAFQDIEDRKNYCIAEDIDLSSIRKFRPIQPFSGTLDGNNKKISGLKIVEQWYQSHIGIFANIKPDGEVKNLIIENVNISTIGGSAIGIITGINRGTITNCSINNIEMIVHGSKHVGAIAGKNSGTITNCSTNNGKLVNGEDYIGGLVGHNEYGTITQSYVNSSLVEGEDEVGGLVGHTLEGEINESYTDSTEVKGNNSVGGLVGYSKTLIKNSHTTAGKIEGNKYIGGLVGENDDKISNSYATSDVTEAYDPNAFSNDANESSVGGLVGSNEEEGVVEESYANGNIKGNIAVGGLVGYNKGIIVTSYTESTEGKYIDGLGSVGGLVGRQFRGKIENSYSKINVRGSQDIGGLVGLNKGTLSSSQSNLTSSKIENSYATGEVIGRYPTNSIGGFIGRDYNNYNTQDEINIVNCYFDIITTGKREGIGTIEASSYPDINIIGYSTNTTSNTVQNNEIAPVSIEQSDFNGDPDTTGDDWNFSTVWNWLGNGQWPTLAWQP